jgi:hypothetical protein
LVALDSSARFKQASGMKYLYIAMPQRDFSEVAGGCFAAKEGDFR